MFFYIVLKMKAQNNRSLGKSSWTFGNVSKGQDMLPYRA